MKKIMEEYGLGFVMAIVGMSFCTAIIGFLSQITV